MPLIQISKDVFINPDKIDVVEFLEDGITVLIGDRRYRIEDMTGKAFEEIQRLTGGMGEALKTLQRNAQHFGG